MGNTYANQRIVIKDKFELKEPFVQRAYKDELRAMSELKEYELKLYLRLTQNKEGYKFAFSPTGLVKEIGGSDRSWRDAWKGLVEKGYIVPMEGNEFEILDAPVEKEVWEF